MNNDRKIKDLELSESSKEKETKTKLVEEKKTQEKDNLPKKEDNHSFYQPKEEEGKFKKAWSKKSVKHSVIWGTTFVVALSVGLGVGLGINWSKTNNGINLPGGVTEEELEEWIKERGNYVGIKTDRLADQAIMEEIDRLEEEGSFKPVIANNIRLRAENKAKDQVSTEKDDFKSNHGNSWEKEWIKNLIENGFDNEDEYKDNIIANEIKSNITNLYTESSKLKSISQTEQESGEWKYVSSVKDKNNGMYKAISNKYELNRVDVEEYFELYLMSQKPIAAGQQSSNFSFKGDSIWNGYDGERIEFSSVDEIKNSWYLFYDIFNQEEFKDFYGNSNELEGGIKRIGSSAFMSNGGEDPDPDPDPDSYEEEPESGDVQAINGNFYTTTFLENEIVTPPLDNAFGNELQESGDNDFSNALNSAIKTIVDSNDSTGDWPANITNVVTEDFNKITTLDLEKIGAEFYQNIEEFFNTANGERELSKRIQLGSTDEQALMTVTDSGLSITKVYGVEDYEEALESDDLIGIAEDYVSNDLSYKLDTDDSNVVDQPEYGTLEDFDDWFTSSFDMFVLNEALTDEEFVEENFDEDDLASYDEVVENMYSKLYMSTYDPVKSNVWNIETFLEDNDRLFIGVDSDEMETLNDAIIDNLVFYSFETNDEKKYQAISISEIIASDGDLTGGSK